MKKVLLIPLIVLLTTFSSFSVNTTQAETLPVNTLEILSLISKLREQIIVLEKRLNEIKSQSPNLQVAPPVTVEIIPVDSDVKNFLNNLPFYQSQSVKPIVTLNSVTESSHWKIGDQFSISWFVSGFGSPEANKKEVEVALVKADNTSAAYGLLCRRCGTTEINNNGNSGRLVGNLGVVSLDNGKLLKIEPGNYRLRVRLINDPSVSVISSGVITISPPSSFENLPPVIHSVSGLRPLKVGEQASFKVEAYDPDGYFLDYKIVPGDGVSPLPLSGFAAPDMFSGSYNYTYHVPGSYIIKFIVSDARGTQSTVSQEVIVSSM